ncbi:MAG: leucine-rich repeat domain-containing protein, partial [Ureaplasma sp.]|nr:leucine-rich repeat domain-containing protein [Ureaplasma sp.]
IDVVSVNSSNQLEITLNNRLTKYTVNYYENVELSSNRLIIKNLNYFNLISISDTNLNTLWNNIQTYITTNQVTVDNVDSHISGIRNLTSNIQTEDNQNLANFVSSVTYSNNSFSITLNNNCKMNTKNLNNIQINTSDIIMSNFTFYTAPIVTPPNPPSASKESPEDWFTWDTTITTKITGLSDKGKTQSNIVLPAKTTEIKQWAFSQNTYLKYVDMSLTNISVIPHRTFYESSSIIRIKLPNSVRQIDEYAFYSCTSLLDLTLPNSLEVIGKEAFWKCQSLRTITIPNSVTTLGIASFMDCISLQSITIPNSIKEINSNTFNGCTLLSTVNLPNSLEIIDHTAFFKCKNLKSINLPNSLYSIGENAFNSSGLTSIIIPNSILSIESWTFAHCSDLTSVTMLDGVGKICEEAFVDCPSLTQISLPNVVEIGERAFLACTGLRTLTIPNSIQSIGKFAFNYSTDTNHPILLTNLKIYVSSERVKQLVINSGFNLTNNIIIGSPSTLSIKREEETTK